MSKAFPWTCPYCNRKATITDSNYSVDYHGFDEGNKDGWLILKSFIIVCPNEVCKEYSIQASLYKRMMGYAELRTEGDPLLHWNLKPQSQARVFPTYIPKAILDDYQEACLIRDLSPKASATLSRRCLQGIIRDFHGIKKGRLIDEIDALNGIIDTLVWQAIDAVRKIGNIGAHMEEDINLIIDVEPQEASALIRLIEMLLKDWYIDRHEKQQQLQKIVGIATAKQEIKKTKDVPVAE